MNFSTANHSVLRIFKTTVQLLLLFSVSASTTAEIKGINLTALKKLNASGAEVSGLVIDLPEGKVLAEFNSDQRLGAASLSKLLTSAAALKKWGPRKTFLTRIVGPAPRQGIVHGDISFVGGGDSALDTGGIWQLAAQLSELGILQAQGNLVIDQSLFGQVPCQSEDRCNATEKGLNSYDAPLSSAGINFATWCVDISPAPQSGSPANTRLCQLALPDVEITGQIDTVARDAGFVHVSRKSKDNVDKLRVSGKINKGHPGFQFYRSVSNPPLQTGLVFREVLKRVGITITGDIKIQSSPTAQNLNTLAKLESAPLAEQLISMMIYSNNYMADVITLNLLAETPGQPRPLTLKDAGQKLLTINSLHDGGDNTLILNSGSGLTPENSLSASDIVSVLKSMYLRTDLFPAFVGSLTVPEFSRSNFYRSRDPEWRARIATKTGTMNDPVSISGLAGYFRKKDGNWGAFAILINGTEERPRVPYGARTQAVKETVRQILKQY
ncbi:D-alanyl-D-alanine carboxypeptidase/D-alanyl-D-alanine endopeptidase [Pseudomaricurvus sp.]|uniref:D-alanyl-D-alanine carboxypeptidase/D-alanyl-D-alanine endopeptidase n=1 Tax=Pseudomaricurvus sp. TaxID=2004510 RepID=UPI003F6C6B78